MDSMLGAMDVMPIATQRFSTEGMEFTSAYVSSPKCCPSRTSLLSGRFTHRLEDQLDGMFLLIIIYLFIFLYNLS